MTFTASQIAAMINGRIEGNPDAAVGNFGKIEEAREGQLSFLANPKYEEYLYETRASIIIVNEALELKKTVAATLIRVKDAYSAFATLLGKYQEIAQQQLKGIQEPAYISKTAHYGADIFIGAFAYLGENVKVGDHTKIHPQAYIGDNVSIGDHTIVHAGVRILHSCVIGSHVTIHAGTVIGSDGFGFAPQADGTFAKVPQIGNVVIEDHVEIGANATIDRATIGSTIIRSGAKLDNLIQIAHNVEIGNSTVVAAQAGISGSTKVGKGVMIGGQVGIVGHLHIGDGARINAQSGVSKNIEPGKAVTGSPAYDYTSALRSQALNRRLPDLEKRMKELEDELTRLKK
ncbi:UDP-3-O-(3-hydroxymyristoyl)glucosamine N-acyltransferase [Niabella drilacis]|uniref:UDP-3-O-acylglucosamine N-acyltransferase n=1 Tax=Niabella drilacis (strain DSM 25811 / CCM 8410 / CCUG 62505 / LMG 26954 / E90) TaxID=1285928 RepID=A0A1G6SBY6_NIADE|nr:UDP-3-O-(3-hydroxymyristoyl)glucosamine N-acyltransferase [Niabella drilacis]SDD14412.1 UDP-3-O-[3-hydroxymyristoyl] glucosamine N-acyltransferase [Niabella drilacis]